MSQLKQYLTFFYNDTTTIDGATIAAGAVPTVAQTTCSTDASHARPAMMLVMEGVNTQVDLIEASVAIGSIQFDVQDNRRTADQSTGWLTYILATAGGTSALLGQRISFKQIDQFGVEYNVDMLIQELVLNQNKTVYKITTRDMRERERTMNLFYRAEDSVIWPSRVLDTRNTGSAIGYGKVGALGAGMRTIIKPASGVRANWRLNTVDAVVPMGQFQFTSAGVPFVDVLPVGPQDWNTLLGQYNLVTPGETDPTFTPTAKGSTKSTSKLTGMAIQWRPWGSTGAWTELRDSPTFSLQSGPNNSVSLTMDGFGFYSDESKSSGNRLQKKLVGILAAWHDFSRLPADGQDVEVRVLSGLPPSSEAPMYYEGTFGEFLKRCYDGYYSIQAAGIRYNAAAMANLAANSPVMRLIKTQSESDGLAWLQENWYKPMRMIPLINEAGEIVPTPYDLPDATVSLVTLDQTNVQDADWKHGLGDAITGVEFRYFRDYVDNDGKLGTIEVHVDTVNIAGLSAAGAKTAKFAPETIREITTNIGLTYGKASTSEYGYFLAKRIQAALLDRFSLGGMHCNVTALRSDPAVRGLIGGAWVQLSIPWLPDYTSKVRGINRLMQVVTVKDTDPNLRHLELVDAGPFTAALAAPVLGNHTVAVSGSTVSVTASAIPASVYLRVDVAINPTLPGPNDPAWMMIGRGLGSGTAIINSANLAPGTAWLRVRNEQPGTRSSGWTQLGSVVIVNQLLNDLTVSMVAGVPTLKWTPDATMGGLRLQYQVLSPLDANPAVYANTLDIDASTGTYTLPVTVKQFSRLGLSVTSFPGFSAGAVTGTQGATRRLYDTSRKDDTVIIPELKVTTSETATTGFINLTPYDPSGLIYSVETQTYSGLIMVHDWLAVTPSGNVYSDSVPLIEKQVSIINYRIRIWQPDGSTVYVDQKPMRFAIGSIPITPVMKYSFGVDGTLKITVSGDSDTNLLHLVVSTVGEPTPDDIDAATVPGSATFNGRYMEYTYGTKLLPNQRFYAGARSYNTNIGGALKTQGSIVPERQSDVWIPSTAAATVQAGGGNTAVGLDSKKITINNILFGPMTQLVRVWIREFKTDPGAAADVSEKGYEAPTSPLRISGGSVTVPVANPGNYFQITLVAYDSQNRIGAGVTAWDGVTMPPPVPQGIVNIAVRSTLAAQPAPADLTDLQVAISGADVAVLSMTLPGSNLPATLRVKRDGVSLPDIARTALAGAVQTYNDPNRSPGTTYSYQVFGVNASGIESPLGSPVRTVTFGASTIPAPTVAVGAWNPSGSQGFQITITPAAALPGVTWYIEVAEEAQYGGVWSGYGAWVAAENGQATSYFHPRVLAPTDNGAYHDKVRVIGRKSGYNDSVYSAEAGPVYISYFAP